MNPTGRFAILIPYTTMPTGSSRSSNVPPAGFADLVVDDGSTDGRQQASEVSQGSRCCVMKESRKGAAILTGFSALRGAADWAITLDADGQHDPQDIPALIRAIPQGLRPIVVGRREGMSGADVP